MKNMLKLISLSTLLAVLGFGQTALTQTTTSAAMSKTANTVTLTSTSGLVAGTTWLYIIDPGQTKGEPMAVKSTWNGTSTTVPVQRGSVPSTVVAHVLGAVAVILPGSNAFTLNNMLGSCTAANTSYTPMINRDTGEQWLCSTVNGTWVRGFNTPGPTAATATVASAAGAILPSGPLFTVSGTAAITGFTIPVGFAYSGGFCVVPTGAFTWTTAGNIGLAGTAVVGRLLCFTWHGTSGKFVPSYV